MKGILKNAISIITCIILTVLLFSCVSEPATPTVEINDEGYWVINGQTTDVKARGTDGANGKDGTNGKDGINGNDGKTPTVEINSDGFWVINGIITNVNAEGKTVDENPQGLDFYLRDDGTYAVAMGNARELSHIEIPSSYKGKAVTAIAKYGFCADAFGTSLISITLPDTVTEVGPFAFRNCELLKTVTLGEGLEVIKDSAFLNCTALQSITVTDSTAIIEKEAFCGCENLLSVTLGKSVREIGDSAFAECERLIEIYDLSVAIEIEKQSKENGLLGYHALDVYTQTETPSKIHIVNDDFIFYESAEESLLKFYIGNDTDLTLPDWVPYKLSDNIFYDYEISSIIISKSVAVIGKSVFNERVGNIYYRGTADDWKNIALDSSNSTLPFYIKFYAEEKPTERFSSYWHYKNGIPAVWVESD